MPPSSFIHISRVHVHRSRLSGQWWGCCRPLCLCDAGPAPPDPVTTKVLSEDHGNITEDVRIQVKGSNDGPSTRGRGCVEGADPRNHADRAPLSSCYQRFCEKHVSNTQVTGPAHSGRASSRAAVALASVSAAPGTRWRFNAGSKSSASSSITPTASEETRSTRA